MDTEHELRLESSQRWVRAVLGGVTVVDSRRAALLYETGRLPVYCFPKDDVRTDLLTPAGSRPDAGKGRRRCGR